MTSPTAATATARRGRGGVAFVPTVRHRELVRLLAGLGIAHTGIAMQIRDDQGRSIHRQTLTKHFSRELEAGLDEANAQVAAALFKNATQNNNVAAQIFWLKSRARWREMPQEIALTDPDGNPVEPPSLSDFYRTVMAVATVAGPTLQGDPGALSAINMLDQAR